MKVINLLIPILLLASCSSNYHYSSQSETPIAQVKTDLQTLKFKTLNGVNIQSSDQWNFKLYIKEELRKRTFIHLDANSPNTLDIHISISPIMTKKYKDKFLKIDQFHVDKFISMLSNYKVTDRSGNVMVSETYSVNTQKTEVSNHNYREAERKHQQNKFRTKLHEKLMRKLAKTVVGQIIEERQIKEKR